MNSLVIAAYKPRCCLFFEELDMGQSTHLPTSDKHEKIQWTIDKVGVLSIPCHSPEIPRRASFYQRFVSFDWLPFLSSSLVVVVTYLKTTKLDRHHALVTIPRDTLALKWLSLI